MDAVLEYVLVDGGFTLGSIVKLFMLMIGMDGFVLAMYAMFKGLGGK